MPAQRAQQPGAGRGLVGVKPNCFDPQFASAARKASADMRSAQFSEQRQLCRKNPIPYLNTEAGFSDQHLPNAPVRANLSVATTLRTALSSLKASSISRTDSPEQHLKAKIQRLIQIPLCSACIDRLEVIMPDIP